MRRRRADVIADGGLLALHDLVGDGTGLLGKPEPGLFALPVVRLAEHLHAVVTAQGIHLLKSLHVALRVHRERASAVVVQNAERRHVGGAVGHIDHVLEGHAPAFAGNGRIHVDGIGVLVAPHQGNRAAAHPR